MYKPMFEGDIVPDDVSFLYGPNFGNGASQSSYAIIRFKFFHRRKEYFNTEFLEIQKGPCYPTLHIDWVKLVGGWMVKYQVRWSPVKSTKG